MIFVKLMPIINGNHKSKRCVSNLIISQCVSSRQLQNRPSWIALSKMICPRINFVDIRWYFFLPVKQNVKVKNRFRGRATANSSRFPIFLNVISKHFVDLNLITVDFI